MKLRLIDEIMPVLKSHPSRGAWIEITSKTSKEPHMIGRTPHGVRGLKLHEAGLEQVGVESHPSRGAWIEIVSNGADQNHSKRRTPHGVRGLK